VIRAAHARDLTAIADIAAATGQQDDWSGRNPAYVEHLMRVGRVLVSETGGRITGFGAVQEVGTVRVLCDLFVEPAAHGSGVGRALLAELWHGAPRRMTFSSQHAHALPLYTSFGLDAWWPLLYLRGDVGGLRFPAGWRTGGGTADEVAAFELSWTGIDRTADHRAWAARANGAALVVRRGGSVLAAAAAGGPPADFGLTHLVMDPAADDATAADAVLAALAGLAGPGPTAWVCLPGPHPAVRPLLAAGWRVQELDIFMASEPGLLDPRRAVPSPGQA
jgi:GNAT superfamily N-acetyltransferase